MEVNRLRPRTSRKLILWPYTVSLKGARDSDLEVHSHRSRSDSTILLDLAQKRCCPLLSLQSLEGFEVVLCFRPLEGVGTHLKILQKPTASLMRLQLTSVQAYRKETKPRPKNRWVRFESDCCRIRVHISMFDAEQSQTGQ